ncbi:diguanylate cyclase domain-containing protein [Kibdelosporangium aridum]|uniref:GGDEF domain-containing protein, diguanylate cyclase (C-di-GMP synthetase) or its enzymatically inactive variants n=1 Tax=Kibdelosporangium aridum TaxID=2030 RepID=A0A1W2FWI9_KIBAR|nr:diguanylate cyclase [Kibdelosporangium aridum]SMD26233.1 GGDEF domain-containing protein, diguanylate cyclase (c-di-GMP synthetase) or its enzymatically inactive variants [Kibdelosporangium aridum]
MTAGRKGTWSDGGTTDGELLAETADRLRWCAPELTLVFARQAATLADAAKDRVLALRANALMVAALVRLGKHAEAVEPAVSALRDAENAGERDLAGSVRVDLAASTRAVGLTGSAFVLVRPMLEGSDTRPAVRAGALAEIVGGLAQAGRLEIIDEVLSEADRLYAADDMLSGDVRRILRALLCARIASFRRRWGNATGAVAAATEGMTLLDGLSDPGTDSGQARAELGLEMVSALLDAGEETAAVGQADQTLTQPVRATSAAAIGRLMLILATRVHFPAGRAKEAHALLAEIVRVARRHELDGLLADVLTSLAYAQEADGDLTEALNSLRSARAAEQRRLRADTLARLIVLEELGAGTRLPDDTESLLRRVVRTPARSNPDATGTEMSSREAASREMSGRELAGRGIGPGPRPRPNRGAGTYDSVGYERTGRGTEGYDLAAAASQDYEAAASQPATERYGLVSQDYSVTYDLEGYPTLTTRGYDLASSLGVADDAGSGDTSERVGRRRSASTSAGEPTAPGTDMSAGAGYGSAFGTGTGAGTAGGGGGEGGGGGAPGTSGLAASGVGGSSPHDILGRELAGWEMVARERAAMDLAGQTRAGSDLIAADRAAPEWAGADPAAVDRVVGRAAVDRAAEDMHADEAERLGAADVADVESESDWAATASAAVGSASDEPNRPKGRRAADSDKPKWPDPSQNERDEETGLLNRQGLRRRLAAARRQARPTALTLVRLEPSGDEPEPEPHKKDPDSTDRFSAALIKAIDTAGAGRIPPEIDPDVLTSLADHVRDMAPHDAELARPEEGELAVLLPDTTRDEAEQFAATLRETVSASDWDPEDPARGVNVSTGVAQYQEGTSEDALLSAAREALTHTEQESGRPDWQSVEPLYDLPPEDSGYTFIQEYAGLQSDVADPEMAEYLAGFPLPDYGRQWPSADEPGMPQDDSAEAEGGRSVLDRLDITRGSGGRRRAPDAFKADPSADYDQYAINQPMQTYSNTGDEILAAAEEAERASIPQPPDPDEIPTPPDSPEVPIPPDPDVEPPPGRRRRPAEPEQPGSDPLEKPSPRPRFPAGPDIPSPEDPDADPDPQRRRWTSELDPGNPRARRRALPRDPTRRAVEPDDNPETTGRRRMPDIAETPEAGLAEPTGRRRMPDAGEMPETPAVSGDPTGRRRMPDIADKMETLMGPEESAGRRRMPDADETPQARTKPGESTGRRRMPEPFEEPEFSSRIEAPKPDAGQSTGRRRMPQWPDSAESQGGTNPESRTAPGESTVRRRMPDAWPSEPESTGRRLMPEDAAQPGRRRVPEDDPESGQRRMPEAELEPDRRLMPENDIVELETPSAPERTGRRRKPDPLDDFEYQRGTSLDPADVARRHEPATGNEELGESAGRRRMPDPVGPETGSSDPRGEAETPRGYAGRRRMPDPDGLDQDPPAARGADALGHDASGRDALGRNAPGHDALDEPTGRRRMPESASGAAISDDPSARQRPGEKTRPNISESLGLEAILGEVSDQRAADPRIERGTSSGMSRREAGPHEAAGRQEPSGSPSEESRREQTDWPVPDSRMARAVPDEPTGSQFSRSGQSTGSSGLAGVPGEDTGLASDSRRPGESTGSQLSRAGQSTGPSGLEAILGEQTGRSAPDSRTPRIRSDASSLREAILRQASGQSDSEAQAQSSVDNQSPGPETRPGRRRAPEPVHRDEPERRSESPLPPPQRQDALPTSQRQDTLPASRRQDAPLTSQWQEVPPTSQRQDAPLTSQWQDEVPASQRQEVPPTSQRQDAPSTPQRQDPPPTPQRQQALPPQQSGPVDDFPTKTPEVFSLGPEGLSRRPAVGESGAGKATEPVEKPIQPDESPVARRLSASGVDELSKRRLTEGRPERPRRRTERAADEAGDDRPSRLRRRERTDLKLADLLAEALVAYQSSTSETPDQDVLSAYEDLDTPTGEDTDRHRGETGY